VVRPMRRLRGTTLLLAACVLCALPARAADGVALPGGIVLHCGVDVYGDVNFNLPVDRDNWFPDVGTTAKKGNEFSVNLVSVDISKEAEPVGFHLWLAAGTGATVVHQAEPAGPIGGVDVWQYVQAASISAKVPLGRGLLLEAGIMPSFLGFEGLASWTNWTYTRSYSSEFSPYYEAGVRAAYAFDEHVAVQVRVLNGWQSIGDVNNAKSYGAQVALTYERWSLTVNGYAGPDLPNDDVHWRFFGDIIASVTPWTRLQLVLETSGGTQQEHDAPTANWAAAALYGRWTFLPQLAAVLRGEVYRDAGGLLSGTRQTLVEWTATLAYTPWPALVLKLEGRYDRSTANVFTGSLLLSGQGPEKLPRQALLLLGAVAQF
jgi:Putative beta-barrel porin-2, OmpL-like. bbp2